MEDFVEKAPNLLHQLDPLTRKKFETKSSSVLQVGQNLAAGYSRKEFEKLGNATFFLFDTLSMFLMFQW